ncbi:hypothetical protein NPIL_697681 [Nephila pilipes]|uniref:Uncharacterized protein n=1 Tax=Nephila pilipes TaxID=299642 RepID=A0A8X6NRZ5_NEPPI|nr:hypothetical protein NPIL_697681 [Nephila pilipes]
MLSTIFRRLKSPRCHRIESACVCFPTEGIENSRRLFYSPFHLSEPEKKNTGLRFLVDSCADMSLIPAISVHTLRINDFKLYATNVSENS